MKLPYVQEFKDKAIHVDQVMVLLEAMYEQNKNQPGGNARCAKLAKDVYNALKTINEIVESLDKK